MAISILGGFLLMDAGRAQAQTSGFVDGTATKVTPNPASVAIGSTIVLTATVNDTNTSSPTAPLGNITWTDAGGGGSLSPSVCNLTSVDAKRSSCSSTYTPSRMAGPVPIYVRYAGDAGHSPSYGHSVLSVYVGLDPTSLVVTPAVGSILAGKTIRFTASVVDNAEPPSPVSGSVSWSDGGAGGSFSPSSCSISSNSITGSCQSTYKTPSIPLTATIKANYSGDIGHYASAGTTSLPIIPSTIAYTVSAVVMGGSKGADSPTLTYTQANTTQTITLTPKQATITVDTNSIWFVPNQLDSSSQGEAWNLLGSAQGTATYTFGTSKVPALSFVYYHQISVNLGYQVMGGTIGSSVPPYVSYTSFGVARQGPSPGQTWVDYGTQYSFPYQLPGSTSNNRWITTAVGGNATAPFVSGATYYHQYLLDVSYSSSSSVPRASILALSMGVPVNLTLSTAGQKVWLDAGSQFKVSEPPAPAGANQRWYAAPNATVTSHDIVVAYYHQSAILASAKVSDGSKAPQTTKVATTFVQPILNGTSGGRAVVVFLQPARGTVWLDDGTPYVISKTLLVLPTERWLAADDVKGTVAQGATADETYYHQFLVKVSYSQSGSAPGGITLDYSSFGAQAHGPVTTLGSSIWADAGTPFVVPTFSPGERWYSPATQGGVSSSGISVTLYHQYELNVTVNVVGGGLPAQPILSGTSSGQPMKALLGTQPVQVWLDSGTSYVIPQKLLLLTDERWVGANDLIGVAASAASVTQTYYHQVFLNFSLPVSLPSPPPSIAYFSLGQSAQHVLGGANAMVWADAGTKFSVPTEVGPGAGERWYPSTSGANATSPILERVQYYHQYTLAYGYSVTGGTMTVPPSVSGIQGGKEATFSLTTQTGQIWLDGGTPWQAGVAAGPIPGERWLGSNPSQGTIAGPASVHLSYFLQFYVTTVPSPAGGGTVNLGGWYNATNQVALQAIPGQGWTLGGWTGIGNSAYTGTNPTVSVPVLSPMNETAVFEPSLTIISSNGGSVKYTTGPSVQSISAGRSVQAFVPGKGQVTLQAHASFPYQFVTWTGVPSGSSDLLSLNVNAPTVIQAVFAPSYIDLIGLPAAVFASCLTIYLARHLVFASVRQALSSLKTRVKELVA